MRSWLLALLLLCLAQCYLAQDAPENTNADTAEEPNNEGNTDTADEGTADAGTDDTNAEDNPDDNTQDDNGGESDAQTGDEGTAEPESGSSAVYATTAAIFFSAILALVL